MRHTENENRKRIEIKKGTHEVVKELFKIEFTFFIHNGVVRLKQNTEKRQKTGNIIEKIKNKCN